MTMNDLDNPRAVPGGNLPPNDAQLVTDQMARDYAALVDTVDALLEKAKGAPEKIESDDEMAPVVGLIKELRDADKRLESHREAEKLPHLRRSNAIDGFFFAIRDLLGRRVKTAKMGAIDILQARVHDWQTRKLLAEQQRRAREAAEAAERERVAREAQDRADREAEEARLAAERARKPETIEAKTAVAQEAAVVADAAQVETLIAGDAAAAASLATFAKPADLVRTRTDEGMATMAREAYAEVTDFDKLDRAKLWPFIRREEIEKALRAWAKTGGHRETMEGASIGHRQKTVVR